MDGGVGNSNEVCPLIWELELPFNSLNQIKHCGDRKAQREEGKSVGKERKKSRENSILG